ncbi:MAG TPA: hypothetical protein PLP19_16100 [bacterium]|nr:hypothetical protein [bacterium]HPN45014.1 hypothetical protein [bacterium]
MKNNPVVDELDNMDDKAYNGPAARQDAMSCIIFRPGMDSQGELE